MATISARMTYEMDANGCHIWQRARNSRGYGVIWYDGKLRLAHRVAWLLTNGAWPDAQLVVDHICDNKGCINPEHLRLLTNWQNVRRTYSRKSDPAAEARRAANRRAQAKMRGTYSPSYRAERV